MSVAFSVPRPLPLTMLLGICLLGAVADLARSAASDGNAQLRQKPLGQHQPGNDKQRESKPLIHVHCYCKHAAGELLPEHCRRDSSRI